MRAKWRWTVAAAVLAPLAACGPKPAPPAPAGVSLAGSWVLNADASQNPGPMAVDTADGRRGDPGEEGEGRSPGEPGRGGGFGRGGMGRGGRMGRGGGMDREGMRRGFAALRERPERLDIEQAGNTVTISVPGRPSTSLVTDGKKHGGEGDEGGVSARWKDGVLVVDRSVRGMTVRRIYEHAPGSPRLIVTTELRGGPREMQFRTVYDQAPASR
ncbi:MAG TPA: hypothetical protein VFQ38_07560 [Longimicrobiales bacterium]|nr:hypothetical protein [Longimicrobiales bacterium]